MVGHVCVCVDCISGLFIHLVKLRVSWIILGGVRWFGGTLNQKVKWGGSLGELWEVWVVSMVDFNGFIVMVYRFYCT